MALRIRRDGRILCAAMHGKQPGDTYIPDGTHYELSVVEKVLVTEPHEQHQRRGEWWWKGNVPAGIKIDKFYLTGPSARTFNDIEEEFFQIAKAADELEHFLGRNVGTTADWPVDIVVKNDDAVTADRLTALFNELKQRLAPFRKRFPRKEPDHAT